LLEISNEELIEIYLYVGFCYDILVGKKLQKGNFFIYFKLEKELKY